MKNNELWMGGWRPGDGEVWRIDEQLVVVAHSDPSEFYVHCVDVERGTKVAFHIGYFDKEQSTSFSRQIGERIEQ